MFTADDQFDTIRTRTRTRVQVLLKFCNLLMLIAFLPALGNSHLG